MSEDAELGEWTLAEKEISNWRQRERVSMIAAIRDVIAEAQKRAKSPRAPAGERIRWTRLVGQLIWYKDQVLRNMTYEALQKDVDELKREVFGEKQQRPPTVSPRRTTLGHDKRARVKIKISPLSKRRAIQLSGSKPN